VFHLPAFGQTQTFLENKKWGVKDGDQEIIKPIYDTIFDFDSTGKVCLACFKSKTSSANKFIKVMVTTYSCNYLNKKSSRLVIKQNGRDTCSMFSLPKLKDKQYLNGSQFFIATVKNRKYIVTKDFEQKTFKNYQEISLTNDPNFYIVQNQNEVENLMTGLVNQHEDLLVPYQYSSIRINTNDSLIIACAAGTKTNADDDVYDYAGKRIFTSRRHIELATKKYIIHKIFEPKEYYISYNLETKEEFQFTGDDVILNSSDEVSVKVKNDWYVLDLTTNKKKPKNK